MIFESFLGRSRAAVLTVGMLAGASVLGGCDDGGDDTGGDTGNVTLTGTPTDDSGGTMSADDDGNVDSSSGGAAACGENPSTSFATDIQPIIEATCVADCHDPGAAGATAWPILALGMDAGANYDKLVDANSPTNGIADGGYPLVTACDLEDSYLWDKISTGMRIPEGLCKMPLDTYPVPEGGSCADIEGALSQGDLDLIEQWILDGAPE